MPKPFPLLDPPGLDQTDALQMQKGLPFRVTATFIDGALIIDRIRNFLRPLNDYTAGQAAAFLKKDLQ